MLEDSKTAKYFAVIVDSKPESYHVEQTTFLLHYVIPYENHYEIVEIFLQFADTSHKTGYDIAQMIVET